MMPFTKLDNITIVHKRVTAQFKISRKIALISDFHNMDPVNVVKSLKLVRPDFIVINGDLLYAAIEGKSIYDYVPDGAQHIYQASNALSLLRDAVKIAPVLFSTGNHELYLDDKDRNLLREIGVVFLDDSYIHFDDLCFGGLSSPYWVLAGTGGAESSEEHRLRWKMVFDNLHTAWLDEFERQKGYKILLCHHPEFYDPYLKKRKGIDLILSGHAHGGQIRLFGRGLYAYGQGWFPKYTKGIYDGKMIVSSGLANTSRIPRINNPTELLYIVLSGVVKKREREFCIPLKKLSSILRKRLSH